MNVSENPVDKTALRSPPELLRKLQKWRARNLKQAGFDSTEKIANATIDDLMKVEGITPTLARKLKKLAEKRKSAGK